MDDSMTEDHHAISGYTFLLNSSAVSWNAKSQNIVSLSTTESEYIAAMHTAKEATYATSFMYQTLEVAI